MAGGTFRRSEDNGVLTFTFTRDAKLNAVSTAMVEVSAELALTMGLVHAVYPAESFRERATAQDGKD
jgi:enoyl-CoA hydratase/carnithine racemase